MVGASSVVIMPAAAEDPRAWQPAGKLAFGADAVRLKRAQGSLGADTDLAIVSTLTVWRMMTEARPSGRKWSVAWR